VAPLVDLGAEGAELDVSVVDRQLDWSTDPTDSGLSPVDRLAPM
jgi:hypothetical protein